MKSLSLGNLEQQIMGIVWKSENCSVREVLSQFDQDNQEKTLAYTTIATILQRLYDKGLLVRREISAGYIYSPKVSIEKYTKNVANYFLKNFINSFGDTAIASFADSIENLPEKKRKYFLTLLEEHDQNK